ncbi:MAG: hypothetical protein HYY06_33370 [Deltaproteobacteria bacterium]|nr:hypothetical protein [Deltaproteobacteria bacterium]
MLGPVLAVDIARKGRRDFYTELMRDTRGLRREHAAARERWFNSLPWERKEETLFELELLLKGLVCFANPRNHPGLRAPTPLAHDFRQELAIMREGVHRITVVSRQLLGKHERAYSFNRYLESVLAQDHARSLLAKEGTTQNAPEESLAALRSAFTNLAEILDGLGRLGRIHYRLFAAVGSMAMREIGRNVYFNPLMKLEFRPEFDRIRSFEVLEVIQSIESEAGHKVVALAFLSLFRLLRYMRTARALAASRDDVARSHLVFAVMRSDARALSSFLRREVAGTLAEGFEREVLRVPAAEISTRLGDFAIEHETLRRLKATLESVGSQLRLELRRAFGRLLPAPRDELPPGDLQEAVLTATASLTAFLQQATVAIAREFRPELDGERIFDDFISRAAQSERLRRDIWMFAQILRGFIAKAAAASTAADRWAGFTTFRFIRDFIVYFRNMGYQLLRFSDYERFDGFMALVEELTDTDILDPARLGRAVRECEEFFAYLMDTFEKIGQREELHGVTFDRKDAAETLKLYLGQGAGG